MEVVAVHVHQDHVGRCGRHQRPAGERLRAERPDAVRSVVDQSHTEALRSVDKVELAARQRDADLTFARTLRLDRPTRTRSEPVHSDIEAIKDHGALPSVRILRSGQAAAPVRVARRCIASTEGAARRASSEQAPKGGKDHVLACDAHQIATAMKSILAIDTAWTVREPSGVELIREDQAGWDCIALAPSYAQFLALADGVPVDWPSVPVGAEPDVHALLDATQQLLDGEPVDLITIDMPVATTPTIGRRAADSGISHAFGGRGCSTSSPSASRPGMIRDKLWAAFAERSYPLATSDVPSREIPALVEVYPHPALLVRRAVQG